ncbi:MAG: hypothetical protein JL55_17685 [Pseudomonas sp. BICA1-14]|nr:MAG: hypothetical protein JL55_17685 [[Pseudomonas] sp. BICA1-14]
MSGHAAGKSYNSPFSFELFYRLGLHQVGSGVDRRAGQRLAVGARLLAGFDEVLGNARQAALVEALLDAVVAERGHVQLTVERVHQRAGAGGFERLDQLVALSHVIGADDGHHQVELAGLAAHVLGAWRVAQREFVQHGAAAAGTGGALEVEGDAAEGTGAVVVAPGHVSLLLSNGR